MARLTDQQLEELKNLNAARSQGEWVWRWPRDSTIELVVRENKQLVMDAVPQFPRDCSLRFTLADDHGRYASAAEHIAQRPGHGESEFIAIGAANADIIPAAVNALGSMLEELIAARRVVETARWHTKFPSVETEKSLADALTAYDDGPVK